MLVMSADRVGEIVGIAAAARQQRRVFLAQQGFAELPRHDFAFISRVHLYIRGLIMSVRLPDRPARARLVRLNDIAVGRTQWINPRTVPAQSAPASERRCAAARI